MGTHYQGDDREVRALDAYSKLMRCVAMVGSNVQRSLSQEGLTPSQFGVLESLFHLGPMCQKAIGRKLLLSGGNITTVVRNLERRGLVSRTRDRKDRRFVTLALTPEGHAMIEGMFPSHASTIARLMAQLEPEEQATLGALCRKLGRGLEDAASNGS